MKGLFFTNRYYTDGGTEYAYRRLSDCFMALGHTLVRVQTPPVVFAGGTLPDEIASADFGIFWDKDVLAAAMLERSGLRLFNRAEPIRLCDDKRLTYAALSGSGVPLVPTFAAPLCYHECTFDAPLIGQIEQTLGYPVIVKAAAGSLGAQVQLCFSRDEVLALRRQLGGTPHIYQKYIAQSAGRDIRVYVAGGQVLGCIRRENPGGICANRALGGSVRPAQADETLASYALKAASVLGLDYMAADFSDTDTPLLFEVNSNAYFEGIEGLGADIAGAYAAHILRMLTGKESGR